MMEHPHFGKDGSGTLVFKIPVRALSYFITNWQFETFKSGKDMAMTIFFIYCNDVVGTHWN